MRITEINRSRVASVMVRGYFHAFFSGLADALYPGKKRLEPKEYKQLLVNNFDNLSGHFVSVLFPVLIRLNYSDLDTVAEDMKRHHFQILLFKLYRLFMQKCHHSSNHQTVYSCLVQSINICVCLCYSSCIGLQLYTNYRADSQ